MRGVLYGHHRGDLVVPEQLLTEVREALASIQVKVEHGASSVIKRDVMTHLKAKGWSAKVALHPDSGITITSVKGEVGLCLQTGNMGRMYADLLKLQALYLRGTIRSAILILPTTPCAKALGSNIADFDRLMRELPIFESAISAPIAVIGME